MPRVKAASRAAAQNVAHSLAALLSPARAAASRENGARSNGPKTAAGKARSAQNALKHGLRAQKHMVLPGESAAEFAALEAALIEELVPDGALQTLLAQRVVAAAWRLQRAERIEAEIFACKIKSPFGDGDLGLALIRDCNGARSFDTLLRYRSGTLAEFSRALRTLEALQAEAAEVAQRRGTPRTQLEAASRQAQLATLPNRPEARADAGESRCETGRAQISPVFDATAALAESVPAAGQPCCHTLHRNASACREGASVTPIEPERRENPGEPTSCDALGAVAQSG
jgi:hypothetical protein